MNLFEKAVRRKLRFKTDRGDISLEEVLDMPLSSSNGFNLDDLAKSVKRRLDASAEDSFVKPASVTQAQKDDELRLELIKEIIAEKIEARDRAASLSALAERRRLLEQQLDRRNQAELEGKSKDDILAELALIDAEAAAASAAA